MEAVMWLTRGCMGWKGSPVSDRGMEETDVHV